MLANSVNLFVDSLKGNSYHHFHAKLGCLLAPCENKIGTTLIGLIKLFSLHEHLIFAATRRSSKFHISVLGVLYIQKKTKIFLYDIKASSLVCRERRHPIAE